MPVVRENNRVYYVEPNKDDFDNVKYEDLCISLNITTEVLHRHGYDIQDKSTPFSIEISNRADAKSVNFLSGELNDGNNNTFLTTYYIDTHATDIERKTAIEGLGVEKIDISFENFYAPRIQIKFVDVRGSALFGREESIHDVNGSIHGDNIFGVFFTMPYPLFKIQVKGFYGKPVTFQMACESFKGSFNPSTGNFDANVTFIGYQYSLLTDIPVRYIMAAPRNEQYGRAYWESKVNSPEWRLHDGRPPMMFDDIYDIIRDGHQPNNSNSGSMNRDDQELLDGYLDVKQKMSKLLTKYEKLVNGLKNSSLNTTLSNDGQILLTNNIESFNIDVSVISLYEDFINDVNTIKSNNTAYSFIGDLPTLNSSIFDSNIKGERCITQTNNTLKPVDIIKYDNEVFNSYDYLTSGNFTVNNIEIKRGLGELIVNKLSQPDIAKTIGQFWYLIDLEDISNKIGRGLNRCIEQIEFLEKTPSTKDELDGVELLKFVPSIGNVMKILFCHFETFCHILYKTAEQIDSVRRTVDSTNIGVANTDYYDDGDVVYGPFPAVYNNGNISNNGGDINTSKKVLSWVGDIENNPFIDEENTVLGFISAIQKVHNVIQENNTNPITLNKLNTNGAPVLPIDMLNDGNPFPNISVSGNANTYFSTLCGWLGLRLTQIFGVSEFNNSNITNEEIEAMATVDAMNFFSSMDNVSALDKHIITNNGTGLSENIKNVLICDERAINFGIRGKQSFETGRVVNEFSSTKNHPMFKLEDSTYHYVHYYEYFNNNNDRVYNSIVPSKLKPFNLYSIEDKITQVNTDNFKITPKIVNDKNDYSVSFYTNKNDKDIINDSLFGIIQYSNSEISKIIDFYKDKDVLEVDGYSTGKMGGITKVFDRYFRRAKPSSTIVSYYTRESAFFNGKNDFTIDENEMYNFDSCTIETFNFFKEDFYLEQEKITNEETKLYVQSLLFLSYLPYSGGVWSNIKGKDNSASIELVPSSLVALLGGLIWRYELGKDPIKYGRKFYKTNLTDTLCVSPKTKRGNNLHLKNGNYFLKENMEDEYYTIKSFFGVDVNNLDTIVKNKLKDFFIDFTKNVFVVLRDSMSFNAKNLSSEDFDNANRGYAQYSRRGDVGEVTIGEKDYLSKIVDFNDEVYNAKFSNRKKCFEFNLNSSSSAHELLKKTYTNLCYVYFMGNGEYMTNDVRDIHISKAFADRYIDKFSSTLIDINEGNGNKTPLSTELDDDVRDDFKYTRELAIDIYTYLKNLWDKWLVAKYKQKTNNSQQHLGTEYYNVENFFHKNFIFIDKFYENIFDKCYVNMNVLEESIYDSFSKQDSSLFYFISNIVSKQHCLLFILPDFINFGNNMKSAYNEMHKLFTPYTFDAIPQAEPENKFVIVYADRPSEVPAEMGTGRRSDSFSIDNVENLPAAFKSIEVNDENIDSISENNMLAKAYPVPAFGVSFARQNQSIFKNINVNMDNPMITGISATVADAISQLGSPDASRKVYWQGQDIFSIYSSYSYECEVEMMGNAQIMPLMYFQLNNVPMWKGAYMIFSVTHSITPGDMTTRFKGQKMSSVSTPWCTTFVRRGKDATDTDGTYVGDAIVGEIPRDALFTPRGSRYHSDITFESLNIPCSSYVQGSSVGVDYKEWLDKNILKTNNAVLYRDNVAMRCELAKLFVVLNSEYEHVSDYSLTLSSVVRQNGERGEHGYNNNRKYFCNAMDIQISSGKGLPQQNKNKMSIEMFKVIDILLNNHFNQLGQVILETTKKKETVFTDGSNGYLSTTDTYTTLHVSYSGNVSTQVYISDASNNRSPIAINTVDKGKACAIEFLKIIKPFYINLGSRRFKEVFINFSMMDDNSLRILFDWVDITPENINKQYDVDASKYGVEETRVFREILKYIGLSYVPNTQTSNIKRDSRGKAIIGEDGKAIPEMGGLNTSGLLYNLMRDLGETNQDKLGVSVLDWYGKVNHRKKTLSTLDVGDVIFEATKKNGKTYINSNSIIYIYLGNDKVASSIIGGEIEIFDFVEDSNKIYYYHSLNSSKINTPPIKSYTKGEVKRSLWKFFKNDMGFSDAGAAAFMGSIWRESEFNPNGLNNAFSNETGITGVEYTRMVNEGVISRSQLSFKRDSLKGGKTSTSGAFGICQWLGDRKQKLWDESVAKGYSYNNLEAQMNYLKSELNSTYISVADECRKNNVLDNNLSLKITEGFFKPGNHNSEAKDRLSKAEKIYKEFVG